MTIKQAFKTRIWEFPELYKPTYDVAFINNQGEHDEVQFTVNSMGTAIQDLEELFADFCKENGYRRNSVLSITSVEPN